MHKTQTQTGSKRLGVSQCGLRHSRAIRTRTLSSRLPEQSSCFSARAQHMPKYLYGYLRREGVDVREDDCAFGKHHRCNPALFRSPSASMSRVLT